MASSFSSSSEPKSDDDFMELAFEEAKKCECPHTGVGACIVNGERKVVGTGFNHFLKTLQKI